MKCEILYAGRDSQGRAKYWCKTHKAKVLNVDKSPSKRCTSTIKTEFNKKKTLTKSEVRSLIMMFPNLLKNTKFDIFLNGQELIGALEIGSTIYNREDFLNLFISRMNEIKLFTLDCSHCGHFHTDHGIYAVTAHKKHDCAYCGRYFFSFSPCVGNELMRYFLVPGLTFGGGEAVVKKEMNVTYDLLMGKVCINGKNTNKINIQGEVIDLKEYVNQRFLLGLEIKKR